MSLSQQEEEGLEGTRNIVASMSLGFVSEEDSESLPHRERFVQVFEFWKRYDTGFPGIPPAPDRGRHMRYSLYSGTADNNNNDNGDNAMTERPRLVRTLSHDSSFSLSPLLKKQNSFTDSPTSSRYFEANNDLLTNVASISSSCDQHNSNEKGNDTNESIEECKEPEEIKDEGVQAEQCEEPEEIKTEGNDTNEIIELQEDQRKEPEAEGERAS